MKPSRVFGLLCLGSNPHYRCYINALSNGSSRREAIRRISISGGIVGIGVISSSSNTASAAPLQTKSTGAGGLDILHPQPLASSDVFYPSSMIDTNWKVQRAVTSVEGDVGQATLAWELLGGYDERGVGGYDERAFTSKLTEVYEVNFIPAPEEMKDALYNHDGKELQAAICNRGDELSSRVGLGKDATQWHVMDNSIDYTRNSDDGAVTLTVVQRKIEEPPSDSGFGSDEVYRIKSSAGGIFAGMNVDRAARVRRRFRRGFDEASGKMMLDCIEIVTTHRVLDGIAGIELPTSTCKSRMKYMQI